MRNAYFLLLLWLALVPACDRHRSWTSPVSVQAIGREFVWWFRYPGADGVLGTEDDLEEERLLVLPPNVDARILLTSEDFIYTMTLPGYADREIAVPEMFHEIAFHTRDADRFDLLVDPLCSFRFYHDDVMGNVQIESRDDFERWFGSG